jgi:hypothetical protein
VRPGRQAGPPSDTSAWFVIGTAAPASVPSLIWRDAADVSSIQATDRFFDPDAFVAWSGSVYERAIGAWRDKNPELLRPVMAQDVWDRYAQFLLAVSILAIGNKLMSSAVATGRLVGVDAAGPNQSATICFGVSITAAAPAFLDARHRTWQERWLFQRPADSRTHVSGSVAVCLVCGGPADPADSGRCPFCQADITTRTAGWLVNQVATTMPGVPKVGGPAHGIGTASQAGTPLQPPRAG